jgi:hypothetical protein
LSFVEEDEESALVDEVPSDEDVFLVTDLVTFVVLVDGFTVVVVVTFESPFSIV